jgi:UDP-N-acetylglucosamine 1-carboxyvinyltransferase
MGAEIFRDGDSLVVDTRRLEYKTPASELTSKIRASSYLLGSCLSRFGEVDITASGGCNFDQRPIDMHISAAKALGACISGNKLLAPTLHGNNISFDKPSVGATVNALLMAVGAEGETVIEGAAKEPHVFAVIDFLKAAGADIKFNGRSIEIKGRELHGADVEIIPDMIEAGTYLLLAPLTGGTVAVTGEVGKYLDSFFGVLRSAGVLVNSNELRTEVKGSVNDYIEVTTQPYPGYPTDLQPQLCPLMAKYFGGSIRETVWRGRFGYLTALEKFGIKYKRADSLALIIPSDTHPGVAEAPDLRGGAACILAALMTEGKSEILMPEIIKRGYGSLCEKLSSLGADIKITD